MTTPFNGAHQALAQARAQQASKQYQQTQTTTVTPGHLIVMLYDGALRFLRRAKLALEQHDMEHTHQYLIRVQDIVRELDATLTDDAGEISANLHQIYTYWFLRLIEANMNKDRSILDELDSQIEAMLQSWRQAVTAVDTQHQSGMSGKVAVTVEGTR